MESTRNLLTVVADIFVIAEGQPDKLSGLLADCIDAIQSV
jgi:hypothetical protein